MQNSEFRFEINALRAFAVLAVMAYHFGLPGFSGGFVGVDVFFVISGFLISSQILVAIERNTFSFANFYSSRLRRIFPALFVVVVVCLVWGWFFDLPKDYINTNRHAVSALFFVSNIAFDGERGYFDAAAHTKALLHTWSLAIEGQFYLFLPFVLIAVQRFARRYLLISISLLLMLSLGGALYINAMMPGKGFYLLSCRAWEFLAGAMLSTYPSSKLNTSVRNTLSVLGLGLLVISFLNINSTIPWPGIWTVLPVVATIFIIEAGNARATRQIFELRLLQRFGDISYSLYLWHWPVWVFANAVASMSGRRLYWLDQLWMIVLSFVLAELSWRCIECPVRVQRQRWSNKRLALLSLTGVLVVLIFGLANVKMNGMPFRLASYVQRAAEATFINTPRDECFRRGDSTKDAPEQFCKFGAANVAPTLVLWGDSHANQYLTAVTDAAVHNNLGGIIATQSACSARIVKEEETSLSACEKFNQEVYQYLATHPSVKTVILGKWWADLHNEAFFNLIGDLVKSGRKVVLVGVLPTPGFDVPERWAKQQISVNKPIDSMTVPLSSQSLALEIREQVLSELSPLLQAGSVIYVDPLKRFCDEGACRLVEAGASHFRDESHLAHKSSLVFVQDFENAFQQMKQ